ncbi:MAG: class I SAM-dependent methyltransferase, partial [Nanoarchaeota archaeon]
MNEFRAIALNRKNGRVPVFEEILKTIEHIESSWILEIGGFRGKVKEDIDGDGFSIFYWAEFLIKKGSGRLTVVDIDPIAIEKTRRVLSDFDGKLNVEFICADGLDYLKKLSDHPSLVYLDGPDQPEWFTYECFRLINRTKTAVLCDDANGWEIGLGKCPRVRRNYPGYK